jgi:hypothetical protein
MVHHNQPISLVTHVTVENLQNTTIPSTNIFRDNATRGAFQQPMAKKRRLNHLTHASGSQECALRWFDSANRHVERSIHGNSEFDRE